MFALTVGTLGLTFATRQRRWQPSALGCMGGFAVLALKGNSPIFTNPLKPGIGDGGCGASAVREVEADPLGVLARPTIADRLSLPGACRAAFCISRKVAGSGIPARKPDARLRAGRVDCPIPRPGGNWRHRWLRPLSACPPISTATPPCRLMSGLVNAGMDPGAAMAFLIAGGVSSFPAAIAVFALVRDCLCSSPISCLAFRGRRTLRHPFQFNRLTTPAF